MRRVALLGAVLLVLAAVYLVAAHSQPATSASNTTTSGPVSAAVTSVTRSCPPPPPHTGTAHIAMMAMPSQAATAKHSQLATGAAALNPIPAASASVAPAKHSGPSHASTATASPAARSTAPASSTLPASSTAPAGQPVTVSAPGAPATVTAPEAASLGGTSVAATGQMAEGFEAEQATSSGMGTVSCTHPSSDMWFVGTGTAAGAPDVRLYLMNTGDLPASVDVTILTDAGLQNGLNSDITVAPHQFVSQDMARFIRGSEALALHVQTASGQVAASVWEGGGSGGSWLPQSAAPTTSMLIPGLTVASSASRLFITVPGANDARVKVVALTAQGKFPQFGNTLVDVPAGATSSFALASLGASAAALELVSNAAITAGVLVPGSGVGLFTSAAAPVTQQGVVAGNPATRGDTVGLVLTAPAAAVRANIAVVPAGGAAASSPRLTTVPAGHTIAVTVPRPAGRQPFAIVVTPLAGSGPLYAARVVTTGTGGLSATLVSLLPVQSALTGIDLPPARNAYTAIMP